MKLLSRNLQAVVVLTMVVMAGMMQKTKGNPCASSFFSALVELIPCRQAVVPFGNWQPTEACCAAVNALGQACMCVLINGPPISGVDRSLATLLPSKCSLDFDPCEI